LCFAGRSGASGQKGNAIEHTGYAKDTAVAINTLEDALFMDRITVNSNRPEAGEFSSGAFRPFAGAQTGIGAQTTYLFCLTES
jgi:xanthine dehydrogenase molybdopterin-binding subunit B